jgi:hypothetical protein
MPDSDRGRALNQAPVIAALAAQFPRDDPGYLLVESSAGRPAPKN